MSENTLELIRTFTPWMLALFSLLWLVVVFVFKKTYARKDDIDTLRRDHESLVQKVANLPDHEEVADLKLSIERLRGDIKEIRPKLDGLDRISNLLLENELKEKN